MKTEEKHNYSQPLPSAPRASSKNATQIIATRIPAVHEPRAPLQAQLLSRDFYLAHTPEEIRYQDIFRISLEKVSAMPRGRHAETFGTYLKLKITTTVVIVTSTHTHDS